VASPEAAARATVEAVWRLESARLVGAVTRLVRDVGLAEDCANDALVAALQEWPTNGVPQNPAGWLMATAKHRAIDRLRRDDRLEQNIRLLGREVADEQYASVHSRPPEPDEVADDALRLIFIACHPVLPTTARVGLTLRLIGGLTTDEIAHAFLVPEPTVAQRIVRAKKTLADKQIPFEVPGPRERDERLGSVLEVVYLIFNEGYAATAGEHWLRPELCQEALRLGRMLAELAPAEPEVHGLVALMELQASRLRARVDPAGRPIRLADQNRGRWDQLLIRRGFTALLRADQLGRPPGQYVLQAAIAACHARARQPDETDWASIAAIYESLVRVIPSPVVELNRAVAVGMAYGPEAGLSLVDALVEAGELRSYHLLPATRGELLARLGRHDEARVEFQRAADLTRNDREREVLLARVVPIRR
jgi:RNA polymerase sigma-70 factor (ECF subfamily)